MTDGNRKANTTRPLALPLHPLWSAKKIRAITAKIEISSTIPKTAMMAQRVN